MKAPTPEFMARGPANTPPRKPYTKEYTPITATGFQGNEKSPW